MALKLSYLYAAPEVNPVTGKARAIPALNPINVYGRVFFFSWFSFMIAFWAWYTFPPLVRQTTSQLPPLRRPPRTDTISPCLS